MNPVGTARRLAAALAALVLLVGPPLVLIAMLGNPLPDWSAIRAGDWNSQWLRLFACIAWIGWAQWALGFLLEAAAARPGARHTAPHLALGQGLSRALILAIIAAGISTPLLSHAASAFAAPPTHPSPTTVTAAPTPPTQTPVSTPERVGDYKLYVIGSEPDVAPRLWTIAEHHLGNPLRWKEIRDLNVGRTMNDGRVFTDANDIQAGWELRLPADATGLPGQAPGASVNAPASSEHTGEVTVRDGDTLSGIAQRELGAAQDYPQLWRANAGRGEPGGEHFTDQDLIKPGWTITVPGRHAQTAPSAPAHHSPPATAPLPQHPHPAPPRHDTPHQQPAPQHPTPQHSSPGHTAPAPGSTGGAAIPPQVPAQPGSATLPPPQTPVEAAPGPTHAAPAHSAPAQSSSLPELLALFGGGGALLAAGIVAHLRWRRRIQQRRRGYRRVVPAPTGAAADVEFAAQVQADPVDAAWLDESLRVLAGALAADPGVELPNVVAAYLGSEELELALAEPADPAPEPFHANAGGTSWTLSKQDAAATPVPPEEALPPLPALATVGITRTDTGQPHRLVLLDVEGIGSLAISGDHDHVVDVLRFMAGDLAYNGWSAGIEVITCGMGTDLAALAPDRIHCVTDVAELGQYLLADKPMRPEGNPLAGRIHDDYSDAWLVPRVVLIAECRTGEDTDAVRDLLAEIRDAGRSLLGIVLAGEHPDANWQAHLDHHGLLHLPDLGELSVEAQQLPAELVPDVAEEIAIADAQEDLAAPPATEHASWAQGTDVLGGLLPYPDDDLTDPAPAVAGDSEPDDAPVAPDGDDRLAAQDDPAVQAEAGDADPGPSPALPLSGPTSLPQTAQVRALRPDLEQARQVLSEREGRDPNLDEDLARYLDPAPYQALASLLGPVRVTGTTPWTMNNDASEAMATEIVLYLLLSEFGRTGQEVDEHLFPNVANKDQRPKRIRATRKWLATDEHGELYLPHANKVEPPRYLITSSMLLDWYLFKRLRARAQARALAEYTDLAINDYRAALELVQGPPFADLRPGGYRWLAYCGGLEQNVLSAIVDTAHELAMIGMDRDAGDLVDWAATRCVLADPVATYNQPYADRMRYQMRIGNKDRFSEIVRELIAVRSRNEHADLDDLDLDGEPAGLIREFLGRDGLRALGS
jgi:hypothetical protein